MPLRSNEGQQVDRFQNVRLFRNGMNFIFRSICDLKDHCRNSPNGRLVGEDDDANSQTSCTKNCTQISTRKICHYNCESAII